MEPMPLVVIVNGRVIIGPGSEETAAVEEAKRKKAEEVRRGSEDSAMEEDARVAGAYGGFRMQHEDSSCRSRWEAVTAGYS